VTAAIVAAALSFSTFDALAFPMFAAILFLLVGCGGALWRLARQPPLIGARHTSRADYGAL